MRRYRKSYLRSFANGVLLACLPVAAFFGADYLLAPPAPGSDPAITVVSPADVATATAGSVRQIASGVTSQGGSSQLGLQQIQTETATRQVNTQGGVATSQGKGALVAAIQGELVRVGCYAGEPDGAWNDRTRAAMQAFNTSVHVNLSTNSPDYILLTLLQGHSAKACTRSCEPDARRSGSCVDKSIEARTIAPPASGAGSKAAASSVAPAAWTSTVVVAAPGTVTTEMLAPAAKAALAVAPRAASPDLAGLQLNGEATGSSSAVALDGRMAIGVLPPPPENAVTQAIAKPRIDAPRSQRGRGSGGGRSPRSAFSDLSINAP